MADGPVPAKRPRNEFTESHFNEYLRWVPFVDCHAHSLLTLEHMDLLAPDILTGLVSPASHSSGGSAGAHRTERLATLPYLRALRELAEALGMADPEDQDPTDIQRVLRTHFEDWRRRDDWTRLCLIGTECIMLDDAFESSERVVPVQQMLAYTQSQSRRIVRIEAMAHEACQKTSTGPCAETVDEFLCYFDEFHIQAMESREVAAFMTLTPWSGDPPVLFDWNDEEERQRRWEVAYEAHREKAAAYDSGAYFGDCEPLMVEPVFGAYLVYRTALLVSQSRASRFKPILVHFGFDHATGRDAPCGTWDPLLLRPLFETFPQVPFVLLHAAAPWLTSAAYLAQAMPNVYVDTGAPGLSREGQERVLRTLLELAPWTKLLAGTGTHSRPEGFYVGRRQIKEALGKVFRDLAYRGDLTWADACRAVKAILFGNANHVFRLRLHDVMAGDGGPIVFMPSASSSSSSSPGEGVVGDGDGVGVGVGVGSRSRHLDGSGHPSSRHPNGGHLNSGHPNSDHLNHGDINTVTNVNGIARLDMAFAGPALQRELVQAALWRGSGGVDGGNAPAPPEQADWLAFCWVDYTGMHRQKRMHVNHLWRYLSLGLPATVGITKAVMALLQTDWPSRNMSPSGEYRLYADWSWIRHGADGQLNVYGEFRDRDGKVAMQCPRTVLRTVLEAAKAKCGGLEFRVGFEIQFVLLHGEGPRFRQMLGHGQCWASSRATAMSPVRSVIDRAVRFLVDRCDFEIETVHAGGAPGQFEVVLAHQPPLEAVYRLLHARQVLADFAAREGYLFTLHPKPVAGACGTVAHAHISVSSPGGNDPGVYESFYAGILNRLPAVAAFTLPSPVSWERHAPDGVCSGGRWVAWGTQNRETPLRKVCDSHWEFRAMDGLANPFLAVAAVLAAGVLGVRNAEPLRHGDLVGDPARMTIDDLRRRGITHSMPKSTAEALAALSATQDLQEMLGLPMVTRFIEVKESECEMWENHIPPEERWQWVVDRY